MKITTSLNGDGDIRISINTNLIKQFFPNLKGMTLNHRDCPKNVRVEKIDSVTALITIVQGIDMDKLGPEENGMIGVPTEFAVKIQSVLNIVNEFLRNAVMYCVKRTEFIPLYDFSGTTRNYSFDEMKEDVVKAMQNKRNLCIIDKFQDYLDNEHEHKYCFNQYMIDYNTMADEYVDFILAVKAGKLEELRTKYSGKLTRTEWV